MHPSQRLIPRTPFAGMGPRTATRRLGRKPRPWAFPPRRGLFRRGLGPRSFELLKTKGNVKSGSKKKRKSAVGKGQVGPRLPPGPVLGGKCEAFQSFCIFCVCPSFLCFSSKNVGSIYCEKLVLFYLEIREERRCSSTKGNPMLTFFAFCLLAGLVAGLAIADRLDAL